MSSPLSVYLGAGARDGAAGLPWRASVAESCLGEVGPAWGLPRSTDEAFRLSAWPWLGDRVGVGAACAGSVLALNVAAVCPRSRAAAAAAAASCCF